MLITLTTDFGYYDNFVGVMKGVILTISPQVSIVDICHNIPPQDVFKTNWIISSATPYFPKNTLHVIVVDPGVGSERRIIYVRTDKHHFLAPDNGVLSSLLLENIVFVREVTNREFFLEDVSSTFHGRDIFSPVAAHIANGIDPELLGPLVDSKQIKRLHLPEVEVDHENKKIYGSVVYVDHFGNIITNITKDLFTEIIQEQKFNIHVCGILIKKLAASYSSSLPHTYVALFNSEALLEIANNLGNAASNLGAKVGMDVAVEY